MMKRKNARMKTQKRAMAMGNMGCFEACGKKNNGVPGGTPSWEKRG